MLPNLSLPDIKLYGPIGLHPFGVLAATAIAVGFYLARRRAGRVGLDVEICSGAMMWAVIVGLVFAHWVSALFYYPKEVLSDPLYLLRLWEGFSSFGGFAGGFLGAFIYLRRKHQSWLKYADAILFGLAPAWIIGRLGCAIVFDHPGLPSTFFLAMTDGQGVARHNLGFYEMLLAVVLTAVIYSLKDRRVFPGFHLALALIIYAPTRFFLDSLRVSDRTYWGLTPGQYFSVVLFLLATASLLYGLSMQKRKLVSHKGARDVAT